MKTNKTKTAVNPFSKARHSKQCKTIGDAIRLLVDAFSSEADTIGSYILDRAAEEAKELLPKRQAEYDAVMDRVHKSLAEQAAREAKRNLPKSDPTLSPFQQDAADRGLPVHGRPDIKSYKTPEVKEWAVDFDMIGTRVKYTKKGEFVRFIESDTAGVWVRDHYDKSSKTYCFHSFIDVNQEKFVKGSRICYKGFTF